MIACDLNNQKTFDLTITYIILVGAFFGFGSFGLLNLFGIRLPFQIAFSALLILLIFRMLDEIKLTSQMILVSGVLISTFIISHVVHDVNILFLLQLLMALLLFVFVDRVSPHNLRKACRLIGNISVWLCLLVICGWCVYAISAIRVSPPNLLIYHSATGTSPIEPQNWVDWISFTSGDGYTLFNQTVFRMKGYSNEPSATVVHYLAPVVFLLLLKRNYLLSVSIVFLGNCFAIASFTTVIILLISIAIFIFRKITRRLTGLLVSSLLVILTILIYVPNIALVGLEHLSQLVVSNFDLLAKKLETGLENSSFALRVFGISDTTNLVLSSPTGFSNDRLHVAAGLFFIVGATGGWLGVFVLIPVLSNYYRELLRNLARPNISNRQIAAYSILISLLFNACITSGYGWDRIPGILFVLLSFKLLKILSADSVGSIDCKERIRSSNSF